MSEICFPLNLERALQEQASTARFTALGKLTGYDKGVNFRAVLSTSQIATDLYLNPQTDKESEFDPQSIWCAISNIQLFKRVPITNLGTHHPKPLVVRQVLDAYGLMSEPENKQHVRALAEAIEIDSFEHFLLEQRLMILALLRTNFGVTDAQKFTALSQQAEL